MNWFKKKPAPKMVAPPIPLRYGMSVQEWFASEPLVMEARRLYATEWFRQFYSVLVSARPKGYTDNPALQLGRMNGYEEALLLIASLGQLPPQKQQELEATFGAEEEQENQQ